MDPDRPKVGFFGNNKLWICKKMHAAFIKRIAGDQQRLDTWRVWVGSWVCVESNETFDKTKNNIERFDSVRMFESPFHPQAFFDKRHIPASAFPILELPSPSLPSRSHVPKRQESYWFGYLGALGRCFLCSSSFFS